MKLALLMILGTTLSPHLSLAQTNKLLCQPQINQFLGAWGLGSLEHPKGDLHPSESKPTVQLGELSKVPDAKLIKTEKGFNSVFPAKSKANGGVYHQNVLVNQTGNSNDGDITITRSAYVKSQMGASDSAWATYTKTFEAVLDPQCDLKKIVFPRVWKTEKMNSKGAVVLDSKGNPVMEVRTDTISVSADQCRKISKIKADGEVLDAEIRKVLGDQRFETNVDNRTHTVPFDSVKANCRDNGILVAMLPTPKTGGFATEAARNAVREANKANH